MKQYAPGIFSRDATLFTKMREGQRIAMARPDICVANEPKFQPSRSVVHSGIPIKPVKAIHKDPLKPKKVLHLLHRFGIFVCAVVYVAMCFKAAVTAVQLLNGQENPVSSLRIERFGILANHMATLRKSQLVVESLSDSTSPVNGTLYVERSGVSFSKCSMPDVMARIYDDAHLRSVYKAIVEGMSYSLPDIDKSEAELIAPVVDCTIPSILSGDATMGCFYFLLRQRSNPQNVSVLLFLTSNQYYSIPSREEVGNAAFGTMYFFQELHTQRVQFRVAISLGYPYLPLALREYVFRGVDAEGLLSMESILPVDSTEIPNLIKTARRVGFFRNSFTQQSNVNNYAWLPESTREALSHVSSPDVARDNSTWGSSLFAWMAAS